VASTGTRISDQTVRNRLHATQFRARKQAKVPRLTPVHRRNRRNFAQLHRDWTPEQWSNVLFTDDFVYTITMDEFECGDAQVNIT
jgi:hypothetical protein